MSEAFLMNHGGGTNDAKIGDIVIKNEYDARIPYDGLLCNGQTIVRADYPLLDKRLKQERLTDFKVKEIDINSADCTFISKDNIEYTDNSQYIEDEKYCYRLYGSGITRRELFNQIDFTEFIDLTNELKKFHLDNVIIQDVLIDKINEDEIKTMIENSYNDNHEAQTSYNIKYFKKFSDTTFFIVGNIKIPRIYESFGNRHTEFYKYRIFFCFYHLNKENEIYTTPDASQLIKIIYHNNNYYFNYELFNEPNYGYSPASQGIITKKLSINLFNSDDITQDIIERLWNETAEVINGLNFKIEAIIGHNNVVAQRTAPDAYGITRTVYHTMNAELNEYTQNEALNRYVINYLKDLKKYELLTIHVDFTPDWSLTYYATAGISPWQYTRYYHSRYLYISFINNITDIITEEKNEKIEQFMFIYTHGSSYAQPAATDNAYFSHTYLNNGDIIVLTQCGEYNGTSKIKKYIYNSNNYILPSLFKKNNYNDIAYIKTGQDVSKENKEIWPENPNITAET